MLSILVLTSRAKLACLSISVKAVVITIPRQQVAQGLATRSDDSLINVDLPMHMHQVTMQQLVLVLKGWHGISPVHHSVAGAYKPSAASTMMIWTVWCVLIMCSPNAYALSGHVASACAGVHRISPMLHEVACANKPSAARTAVACVLSL